MNQVLFSRIYLSFDLQDQNDKWNVCSLLNVQNGTKFQILQWTGFKRKQKRLEILRKNSSKLESAHSKTCLSQSYFLGLNYKIIIVWSIFRVLNLLPPHTPYSIFALNPSHNPSNPSPIFNSQFTALIKYAISSPANKNLLFAITTIGAWSGAFLTRFKTQN